MVGTRLTELLQQKGYAVRHLNRSKRAGNGIETFVWDVKAGTIEAGAFDGVDYIVHLAGAGIADKRWTDERKKVLVDSRVDTANLLFEQWKASGQPISAFVGASAIGYYGMVTRDHIFVESDPPADMYISDICVQWENASLQFKEAGIRSTLIRVGLVLAADGGALPAIAKPVRFGIGAALGSGKQWMPWIHIDDLCGQFIMAIENEAWTGIFNGVAPNPVNQKVFTKLVGKALKRPVWLPNVPAFLLKAALGEMSQLVLEGSRVSCEKVQQHGFRFAFTQAETALKEILR